MAQRLRVLAAWCDLNENAQQAFIGVVSPKLMNYLERIGGGGVTGGGL